MVLAVIPARYASTRLPGKPLEDIAGKPMVVRVCERARASGALGVTVATDDERILQAVERHGFRAVMTRPEHRSGTDRIAEAALTLGLGETDVVVIVQGDEPLIAPELIAEVAGALRALIEKYVNSLSLFLRTGKMVRIFSANDRICYFSVESKLHVLTAYQNDGSIQNQTFFDNYT